MCIALFFLFWHKKSKSGISNWIFVFKVNWKRKIKQGYCLPPGPKHFFSEDLTEEHEVSRPNSTELKSWDKYTLSFILRFQFKIFTRNERHWKKLENAECILVMKWENAEFILFYWIYISHEVRNDISHEVRNDKMRYCKWKSI